MSPGKGRSGFPSGLVAFVTQPWIRRRWMNGMFMKLLSVFHLFLHLKCFFQVDPGFAYAYTLLGHEFVLTEELDRALACFRNAIRVNNRHYNAWYGHDEISRSTEVTLFTGNTQKKQRVTVKMQSCLCMCVQVWTRDDLLQTGEVQLGRNPLQESSKHQPSELCLTMSYRSGMLAIR